MTTMSGIMCRCRVKHPTATLCVHFYVNFYISWKSAFFSVDKEKEWIWGSGVQCRVLGRVEGGETDQNMLYEGRINKNFKERLYLNQLYPFIKHMLSSQEQNSAKGKNAQF